MPTAIGTSLAIITVNSATGLVKYAGGDGLALDWRIVGMFIAIRTERRIQALRRRQRELVEEWGPGVARQKNQDEDKD